MSVFKWHFLFSCKLAFSGAYFDTAYYGAYYSDTAAILPLKGIYTLTLTQGIP